MPPGPRTALPDLDAPQGAGSSAASADAGLGILAPDTGSAGTAGRGPTAPLIDPTLGGRRRPVGVGATAAGGAETTVVPIRTVLGGRRPRSGRRLLRLRRQMGVAALTMVTLSAGLGSVWTVRAVFAHVPHTQAPAVWRMETQRTPEHPAVLPTTAAASPSHAAKASHLAAAGGGTGDDNSGRGSVSSSTGHRSGSSGSGRKTSGRTPSPSPTEVHHRKGAGTSGGTGGGGADDPATHDATPTIGVDNQDGGSAGNGGGGGGGGTGLESSAPAPTASADPTGGSSGSGSGGSSGGGGGGGGGHDDFVAGG